MLHRSALVSDAPGKPAEEVPIPEPEPEDMATTAEELEEAEAAPVARMNGSHGGGAEAYGAETQSLLAALSHATPVATISVPATDMSPVKAAPVAETDAEHGVPAHPARRSLAEPLAQEAASHALSPQRPQGGSATSLVEMLAAARLPGAEVQQQAQPGPLDSKVHHGTAFQALQQEGAVPGAPWPLCHVQCGKLLPLTVAPDLPQAWGRARPHPRRRRLTQATC